MKTNLMILWGGIMLAATALWACDKNEEAADIDNGQVRFTASIGKEAVSKPHSRAAGTQWAAGDDIGIFMVDHGTNAIAVGADNRQYTTLFGNGIFTPVLGNEIFYPGDGRRVDFIAYYPYREGSKLDSTLPVKVSGTQTAASQAEIDLMWAKADNGGQGYTKESKTGVALNFCHRLSKLTMNCELDPSIGVSSMPDDATVTIKGLFKEVRIDLKDGSLIPATGTDDISPRRFDTAPTGFHAAYDAIIVPMSYNEDDVWVDFTINGETFTWDVGKIKFESGSNHVYEVLITRTGVKATGSIQDWTTVTGGPVTAE